MNKPTLRILFLAAAAMAIAVGSTNAYFTDTDATTSQTFMANWQIAKAKIVINEVYYLGDEEWIELYNAGDAIADIKGWTICNSSNDCGSLNPAKKTVLAPGAFVLVSHSSANLKDWDITERAVHINYAGGKIEFSDAGDAVSLMNAEGTIVDQMSYGTDQTAFSPSCQIVAPGHSLQRSPDGKDTDTSYDFIEQATPILGS